jgi:hypothetical protein
LLFSVSSGEYKAALFKLADAVGVPHDENLLALLKVIRRRIKHFFLAQQDLESKSNHESLEKSAIGVNVPGNVVLLFLLSVLIHNLQNLSNRSLLC